MKMVIDLNYADEIKQRVSMIEILQYYGIKTNGSNFCRKRSTGRRIVEEEWDLNKYKGIGWDE